MQQTELVRTHIADDPPAHRPRLLGSVVVPAHQRARVIIWRAERDLLRLLRFGPQSGADADFYTGFAVARRMRGALIWITRGANSGVRERDDSSRQEPA
jgi:hypothetical protein